MSSSGEDSEFEGIDDLEALQAELDALRAELGDSYVTVRRRRASSACRACPLPARGLWETT